MSLKNEADGMFRNELNEYQGILFIQAFPQTSGTVNTQLYPCMLT